MNLDLLGPGYQPGDNGLEAFLFRHLRCLQNNVDLVHSDADGNRQDACILNREFPNAGGLDGARRVFRSADIQDIDRTAG